MNKIIFVALLVSILMVFAVGTAAASPPEQTPDWAGESGENIWKAHAGAGITDGKSWGEAVRVLKGNYHRTNP
jgi:hypothetical protein